MNDFVLDTSDIRVLLSHMALYGLGAMLDDAGIDDVRIGWTPGMQPRPRITGEALAAEHVDNIVRDHARARAHESSWVQRDIELAGKARGLMSPRLTPFAEQEVWTRVQVARHQELDALTTARAWPDLQLVAALGEPCYWSHNRQRAPLQDDGASRLEMQPRNQGSEFVGSRLRKLAAAVAARKPGSVAAGISGAAPIDEIGSDKVDSRTPTGFANPGPTDNALAWCPLWGIAQLPSNPRIDRTVLTTGHIGRTRQEWFYVPVWETPLRPSRLRTILVSRQLREAAASGLPQPWGSDAAQDVRARSWLNTRGVVGIVRFPIERFGSDSAPERRAMRGVTISLTAS